MYGWEFYLADSEAFKKLMLPVMMEMTKYGGVCTWDGKYYLYASKRMSQSARFYVHEFTEITLIECGVPKNIAHNLSPFGKNKI